MEAARAAHSGGSSVQYKADEAPVLYQPALTKEPFLLREFQVSPILMLYSFILGDRGTETGRWK